MKENNYTKENKNNHIFNFEEELNSSNNIKITGFNNSESKENINLIDNKNDDNNLNSSFQKKNHYIYEKELTTNSKKKLLIRLTLIFLTLIFISIQNLVSNSLISVEKKVNLFKYFRDLISHEILVTDSPINFFNTLKLILNKDFFSGVTCLIYIIFHPFIALKLIYSVSILLYILIVLKCYNQSKRPLWEEGIGGNNEIDIIICETSFSNPSVSIFIINFYFLYSIFCIKEFYKKRKNLKIIIKIFLFILYIAISIFEYIFSLIYKLHFFHEMIFTNILTVIIVCLLIDFDEKFQKKFFNATKTIYKARKNKIKAFLFCFGLMFLSIILFHFISPKSTLSSVEQEFTLNKSCSENQKEELGLKSTFSEIPFIFCMMGAFWGACLSLEKNPGEWWYQPLIINEKYLKNIHIDNLNLTQKKTNFVEIIFLIIKSFITLVVFILIWIVFYKIPYISFEFHFLVSCIKYFTLNFICTGIIPIIFGFLKMNKNIEETYINDTKEINKNIFSYTLFVDYHERGRYPFLSNELTNIDN